ncbi:MAG: cyclopropane fatty-acyl-phospholipid synthase-like methyltransferase [Colwellia sp.]
MSAIITFQTIRPIIEEYMMNKPFSQACENNKQPILDILTTVFSEKKHVLEVGSGTGQHAIFFGQQLPHLTWQTSDLSINHQGINLWLDEAGSANVQRPIVIDLDKKWAMPEGNHPVDGLYTANTLHIISWPLVVKFFAALQSNLAPDASVCIYGPFNYEGKYSSESNANFDLWLKERNVNSGIRDIEAILLLANSAGLTLIDDHAMPANNRLLVFSKS